MLISHRYKFIYFKTVKTAGTSIEVALQPYALPEGQADRAGTKGGPAIVTKAGVVGARGAKFVKGSDWWNHMPAFRIKKQVSSKVWDSYFKFANIRNP